MLYPDVGAWMYSWCLQLNYRNFGWQVAIAAEVLDVIRPVLSEVVHLTLEFQEGSATTELARLLNNPDSEDWSKVLRAFGNVKTLSMHNGLVGEVSRSLLSDGGEYSVDLLPELNKLECYGGGIASDAFAPFINARKNAGHSLILVPFEHFPFRNEAICPRVLTPFYRNSFRSHNSVL